MNPILEKGRIKNGMFASTEADGFNGAFQIQVNGENFRIIASDGLGWRHVSISKPDAPTKVPNWSAMCTIKELFWGDDEWVVQFHPAKKDYVNNHAGCLHLWQPTDQAFPVPPDELTGMKGKSPDEVNAMPHAERLGIYLKANLK